MLGKMAVNIAVKFIERVASFVNVPTTVRLTEEEFSNLRYQNVRG